ncbi:vacuolar iron transporter homolog 4-like isoform X1 [Gastrolobium bilobum]|uniref:vacuolar iron transporter homolog 4-like isoform X1 n=2 Tax=Gastrolobium bilobum TaxID=150636 RepID=UPI002AB0916C|nr:vacuolar iron transporter homolog 4-like isoform X1 [Gastrolobium bilobum]
MASLGDRTNEISPNHVEILIHAINGVDPKPSQEIEESNIDYSKRAQWLRAAVLGANDGLVSVASLMMGVGAVKESITAMILAGFAGLIVGAYSMAIGEFVSVYTQYDIEMAQIKREREVNIAGVGEEDQREKLPNPFHAALASALAFSVGAMIPLLAASFIRDRKIRLAVVAVVASLALFAFGGVGAMLGKTPVWKSCVRVLIGGWIAMAITFGLTKLIGSAGLRM